MSVDRRTSDDELLAWLQTFRETNPIRWAICRLVWGFDPRTNLDRYRLHFGDPVTVTARPAEEPPA